MRSKIAPHRSAEAGSIPGQGADGRLRTLIWLALFSALVLWVAHRLDLFNIWTWVATGDGGRIRLPDTYATVDHPFHAARAETLRRALADGEWLRWIAHHQGGYPVEFYPLGVAWLEVAIWAGLLGALPIAYIHKVAVAIVFLLPLIGFGMLARRDRLSPGVALAAAAAHVSIDGWWWSGGYHELVAWGLITNVAAHVTTLFALVGLVAFLRSGSRWHTALAAGAAAFSLYCNPRSFLPLAVIGIAAVVAVCAAGPPDRRPMRDVLAGLALVGGVAALLAAPEIISLVRFNDLYYFVHYERYDGISAFVDSSIQAVSGPVFVASVAGLVLGLAQPRRVQTRAAALSLLLYASLTGFLSTGAALEGTVEQLELTRLMPFQRLLMIYLAAVAVHDLLRWVAQRAGAWLRHAVDAGLAGAAGLVLVLYVLFPPSFIPEGDRGLYAIPTAADPAIADLEQAVRTADREAPPGTAVLILGTNVSWHDPLWAPFWSDRPYFYDDWLWYWQTNHYGDYNPLIEHAYLNDASTLDAAYLGRHGIGAVVVTGEAKPEAAASPLLSPLRTGLYDVFLVREPVTIVTFDGASAIASTIAGQTVSAQGTVSGGAITIRRNWFPRWRAVVDEEPASITETGDGYMSVQTEAGEASIELTYAVDGWDWAGRAAAAIGLLALAFLIMPGRLRQFPRHVTIRRP